jgi:hypothetical protein
LTSSLQIVRLVHRRKKKPDSKAQQPSITFRDVAGVDSAKVHEGIFQRGDFM